METTLISKNIRMTGPCTMVNGSTQVNFTQLDVQKHIFAFLGH